MRIAKENSKLHGWVASMTVIILAVGDHRLLRMKLKLTILEPFRYRVSQTHCLCLTIAVTESRRPHNARTGCSGTLPHHPEIKRLVEIEILPGAD